LHVPAGGLVREAHRARLLGRGGAGRRDLGLDRAQPAVNAIRPPETTASPGETAVPAAGSRALVVGLGLSGLALSRFLAGRGVRVRVCDRRPAAGLAERAAALPPGTETVLGGYDDRALAGCAAVY